MRTLQRLRAHVARCGFSWGAAITTTGRRPPPHTITPKHPSPTTSHPQRAPPSRPAPYGAGVLRVRAVHLGAEQADAPGVAKELGGGLQHALPAGQVVLCITVKVPAEPGHAAPVLRVQPDIHPRAWGRDGARLQANRGLLNVPTWRPASPPGLTSIPEHRQPQAGQQEQEEAGALQRQPAPAVGFGGPHRDPVHRHVPPCGAAGL